MKGIGGEKEFRVTTRKFKRMETDDVDPNESFLDKYKITENDVAAINTKDKTKLPKSH